jgi:hypothetical protein
VRTGKSQQFLSRIFIRDQRRFIAGLGGTAQTGNGQLPR